MKDTQVAWRASLVIYMQTLSPTLWFCASPSLQTHLQLLTPVICRKHLPPQATHERQGSLIIRAKYDHLGLAAHCSAVSVTHPHTLLISLRDFLFSSAGHVKPASASQFSQMFVCCRSHHHTALLEL